jgi:hypothetical protein
MYVGNSSWNVCRDRIWNVCRELEVEWNHMLLSTCIYMKPNITHFGSAALYHHGPRQCNVSYMNTSKVSLMNGDDTLILSLIARNIFVKYMCKNCQVLHLASVAKLFLSRK